MGGVKVFGQVVMGAYRLPSRLEKYSEIVYESCERKALAKQKAINIDERGLGEEDRGGGPYGKSSRL